MSSRPLSIQFLSQFLCAHRRHFLVGDSLQLLNFFCEIESCNGYLLDHKIEKEEKIRAQSWLKSPQTVSLTLNSYFPFLNLPSCSRIGQSSLSMLFRCRECYRLQSMVSFVKENTIIVVTHWVRLAPSRVVHIERSDEILQLRSRCFQPVRNPWSGWNSYYLPAPGQNSNLSSDPLRVAFDVTSFQC